MKVALALQPFGPTDSTKAKKVKLYLTTDLSDSD